MRHSPEFSSGSTSGASGSPWSPSDLDVDDYLSTFSSNYNFTEFLSTQMEASSSLGNEFQASYQSYGYSSRQNTTNDLGLEALEHQVVPREEWDPALDSESEPSAQFLAFLMTQPAAPDNYPPSLMFNAASNTSHPYDEPGSLGPQMVLQEGWDLAALDSGPSERFLPLPMVNPTALENIPPSDSESLMFSNPAYSLHEALSSLPYLDLNATGFQMPSFQQSPLGFYDWSNEGLSATLASNTTSPTLDGSLSSIDWEGRTGVMGSPWTPSTSAASGTTTQYIQDGPLPRHGSGTMGDTQEIQNPLREGVDTFTNCSGVVGRTSRKRKIDATIDILPAGLQPDRRTKAGRKPNKKPVDPFKPANQVLINEDGRSQPVSYRRRLQPEDPSGTKPFVLVPVVGGGAKSGGDTALGSASSPSGESNTAEGGKSRKKKKLQLRGEPDATPTTAPVPNIPPSGSLPTPTYGGSGLRKDGAFGLDQFVDMSGERTSNRNCKMMFWEYKVGGQGS